jgi:UDP-N-acetylglucosamine 4-epimerase
MNLSNQQILNPFFKDKQSVWLVTGAAGFIGSHLTENLLKFNQKVIAVDNFSNGKRENLEKIKLSVGEKLFSNLTFYQGDITDKNFCDSLFNGVDYCLHQAALGSVPKSIEDPIKWNEHNITGTLNIFYSAMQSKSIKGFVYASSSSVYGDHPDLPKVEEKTGKPLSPYAASKYANELYANTFNVCYRFPTVGLRYFNVFGPRQDPQGVYAAVIPKWISMMLNGEQCIINGDGTTSRDFCFIDNVVQANILGALKCSLLNESTVFNVGVGDNTNLNQLHAMLASIIEEDTGNKVASPRYEVFREGDIKHSLASIDAIKNKLQYQPTHRILEGLKITVKDYIFSLHQSTKLSSC